MKKSKTQMTKAELIAEIKQRDQIIAELNSRIDELEHSVIQSQAHVLDADSNKLLDVLRKRIEHLEQNQSPTTRSERQG